MSSIDTPGFELFIASALMQEDFGFAPPHVTAERFETLAWLVDRYSREARIVFRYLALYRRFLEIDTEANYIGHERDERPDEPRLDIEVERRQASGSTAEGNEDEEASNPSDPSEPSAYLAITLGPLRERWHIRPGDDDGWPSIPHGHLQHKSGVESWPKMDPFRGAIFDSASVRRSRGASRAELIALWSDKSFRDFVKDAMIHFEAEHPRRFASTMRSRGISDPWSLPRWR